MSIGPHFYLLSKTLRSRAVPLSHSVMALSSRSGGGGHFERPDPKLPTEYKHTRRIHLEDINTILYHDFAPEFHMHLHSPFIQNGKQGVALVFIYFCLVLAPAWAFAQMLNKWAGS